MTTNFLEIIEKSGKPVNLNYTRINKLLWKDPETGAYPHLYSLYLDHKDAGIFPSGVTGEEIMTTLRVELKTKLQEIEDILYFKDLEDSLITKVEKRLGQTTAEFREVIGKVMGTMTVLDFKRISQIRSADRVDILEGDLRLSQKTIEEYIKLVRAEVGLQLSSIGELENKKLKTPDKNQKTRDMYEKVGYLFKFLASNIEDDTGAKKAYLKAFLMKKMRSEKGFAAIKAWYEELQGHMKGADFGDCRQSIKVMVDRLHKEAEAQRGDQLREILKKYANDVQISDQDINAIFQKDANGNDVATVMADSTYVQKIGYHLEEIESTNFQLELETTMPDVSITVLTDRLSKVNKELKALKNELNEWHEQKHTVVELIETKFKKIPLPKRLKLRNAAESIATITDDRASVKPHQLAFMARLQAVESGKNMEAELDEILSEAEGDVVAYLVKQGCHTAHLSRLKNHDPDFDIYSFLREQVRDRDLREDQGQKHERWLSRNNLADIAQQLDHVKRLGSVEDMVTLISAVHYTKGLTPESLRSIDRLVDASDFSEYERDDIYAKLEEFLQRSSSVETADEAESLPAASGIRIKNLQRATPSDLEHSLFESEDNVPPPEVEEEESEGSGSERSTLENSHDFEARNSQRSSIQDEKIYGDALTQEQAKDLDTQEFLTGDSLEHIRGEIWKMDQICRRNFSEPNDLVEFDLIKARIENLSDSYYKTQEAAMDEYGKNLMFKGEEVMNTVKARKKLPYVDDSRLQSMLLQRDHKRVFEKSQQKLAGFSDLEKDNGKIQDVLSVLYAEMYEWGNESQTKKLTKVMSIDHPLTAIRFNAAKKQPFMSEDGERYQMLDIKGRPTLLSNPATYKERAQELLKDAKRLMKDGNFAQLRQLFRQGESGDRLYMDSAFFPLSLLKGNNTQRTDLLYEQKKNEHGEPVFDKKTGKPVLIPSQKIPADFQKRLDLTNNEVSEKNDAICHDPDLKSLPDCLADDAEFISAIKLDKETQALINEYQEAIVLNEETGETTIDEEKVREIIRKGKKVKGAGAGGVNEDESIKLTKERLEEIAKDNPLAAARAAQFKSEMLGSSAAGLQHAARLMVDTLKLGPKMAAEYGQMYWKGLTFYSPMSLYFAVEQAAEHISKLADFRVKFKSYMLMANLFKGTIIGSEFEKLLQSKENERVDDFKKSFDQYGNNQILEKLTGARDRFEFKQTLIQVFQERGLATNQDLCNVKFLKTLNKFNPSYTIRIKWTDDQMRNDDEIEREVMDEIKKSVDKFWGEGQFAIWKNAGVQKYEGWRKQSFDNFSQYGGGSIREKIYTKYWNWITKDPAKLRAMHPGELVGNIENDMVVGHLNSGASFAIFQALLMEGIIKYEHLKRLELTDHHINNLPFFTFLEPKEAELAGLKEVYEQCKHLPYHPDKNPFVGFYEGKTALKLRSFRFEGKWIFAKNQADYDAEKEKGNIKEVVMTAHQLQRRREAQPEWFKKMDNACIGLFIPSYNWGQIEAGLNMDNNGEINGARPHDICAGYRGMQWEFTSYLEAMSNKEGHPELDDVTRFKQQIYFAYEALSKNGALAGYFSRQKNRKNDYAFNSDGSPNFDHKVVEERAKSGKSNFERQILDISGHNQRLNESATTLDAMKAFDEDPANGTITYDMRRAFKRMSGHKHLKSIGMDEVTGKKNPAGYRQIEIMTFDPSGIYRDEAIPAFVQNVLLLAQKRGIGKEIAKSLAVSSTNPTGVFGNFGIGNVARDHILNEWRINEAQML